MEWVSSWIQGIIVAVIIATIIEMILPEGNSKKYIKVVIGIYILFSIISPVITKITRNDFRVSDIFDLDQYIEASKAKTYEELNTNQEQQIKDVYISNLKNDIKQKIQDKGYEVLEINVVNDEEYTLQEINIKLQKTEKKNEENENNLANKIEEVDEIKVVVNGENIQTSNGSSSQINDIKEKNKNDLNSKEKEQLKEYLSGVYEIKQQNININ